MQTSVCLNNDREGTSEESNWETVEGHDFSRAAKAIEDTHAFAPEVCSMPRTLALTSSLTLLCGRDNRRTKITR